MLEDSRRSRIFEVTQVTPQFFVTKYNTKRGVKKAIEYPKGTWMYYRGQSQWKKQSVEEGTGLWCLMEPWMAGGEPSEERSLR